jgi:hypothetical protein
MFEQSVAVPQQRRAALEAAHRLFQADAPFLEVVHDLLEFGECLLE